MELSSGRTPTVSRQAPGGPIRRNPFGAALASHSKFKPFTPVPGPDLAISVRIIKRGAVGKRSSFRCHSSVVPENRSGTAARTRDPEQERGES
jgi:hypothetical protein